MKNYNCALAHIMDLYVALCGRMENQMKKTVSLLLSAVLVLGLVFSLASCTEAPADAGAEISVYLGADVYDFDPTDYYVDSNAEQVMSLMFEPLFKLDSEGNRRNAMAKDYEVDIIDREIEIFLRESYWSDGSQVTASDFVYAWREVLLEPNKPNPAAALLYDIENAVAIKAGDKSYSELAAVANAESNSIVITYREGADYEQLLDNLASVATSPLRQSIVSLGSAYWSKDVSTIVTNGPFKVESLNYYDGEFTLARNIGYHQKVTEVEYTQHVTPNTLISFFSMGEELSLTYEDIEDKTVFYMGDATLADRAENKDKAKVSDDLSVYSYVFNTSKAPFNNADVRRALSLALDRDAIAEAIVFGKAANGFLTEQVAKSVYGNNVSARLSGNMTEAKSLIEAANLSANEKSFTLTVNNDEESLAIAELAKAAWEELGFTVKVEALGYVENEIADTSTNEKKTIIDSAIQSLIKNASYGKVEYDVIAVDWQLYSGDAFVSLASLTSAINGNGMDFLQNCARSNITGWSNTDYDSYLNAAFNARSDEDRKNALAKAEEILLNESPIVPVVFNQSFAFISSELSGITVDALGNFVLNKANLKNYHDYLPDSEEE